MASYDDFGDTPNQIRIEGQEITLTRTNTSPTTVLLTWNLPESVVSGCAEGVYKGAYDGIVITSSLSPFSIQNAPVDRVKYVADPSADPNLHVGDKIGNSLVVGAFYNDNKTISLEVSDVNNNVAQYFSAFAVTKEFKYHNEGVHSYEQTLSNGTNTGDTPGYQEVLLGYQENYRALDIKTVTYTTVGMTATDKTGLDPNQSYTLNFRSDRLPTETQIIIHGSNAHTYNDLVNEINRQVSLIGITSFNNGRPNAGTVYVDVDGEEVYIWDGDRNIEQLSVFIPQDFAAAPTTSDYWYDEVDQVLYKWDGSIWVLQDFFVVPNLQAKELYWFNTGTSLGYKYEGTGWCPRPSSTSIIDPRQPQVNTTVASALNINYWYNTTNQTLYHAHLKEPNSVCWDAVEAIYDETDPNAYPPGYYWFDDVHSKVYLRSVGSPQSWVEQQRVTIGALNTEDVILPGDIWVDVENDQLYVRDFTNTWVSYPFVTWGVDPSIRIGCDLWWESTTDILWVWSQINGVYSWQQAIFYQQALDPSLPFPVEFGFMWFDPSKPLQHQVSIWDGTQWVVNTDAILHVRDPLFGLIPGVDHFINLSNGEFNIASTNSAFIATVITPQVIVLPTSPNSIVIGTYWYSTNLDTLGIWNGTSWDPVVFTSTNPTPLIGTKYYDTLDNIAYEWIGYWAILVQYMYIGLTDQGTLLLTSPTLGCKSYVVIDSETVFSSLGQPIRIWNPYIGTDGISDKPSYATLGVGTDGSTDERRELIDRIRFTLGHPTVEVELTRQQLDHCVDLALQELRQKTSIAYQRVMFFMETQPGVQKYKLTNKCVGYNKIVNVVGAHRMQSSHLGAGAGQGAYGQAMLQHLYQMGGFDLISYYLVSEYVELMNIMFATNLVFNWHESSRTMTFYQTFGSYERILLDCFIERTEQELIVDRLTKSWVEKFATATAKQILAGVRGKFASLPGAGGGVALNAADLMSQSEAELLECAAEIENYQVDNPEAVGYESSFIMG